jgi:predicted aspartyl protease
MRTPVFAAAAMLMALTCLTSAAAQSVTFVANQPRQIPFELSSGYLIVVEGSIGDSERLRFVVDTGTTRTCVDRRLATKLALPLAPHTVFRFGQAIRLSSGTLPALSIGPLRAERFLVNVTDLSGLRVEGGQIDAIIGLDLLGVFPFEIDYKQMRISFGPLEPLAESASMEQIPWLPVVSLRVDQFTYRVLIDTGARNIVFYSERLKGAYHHLKKMDTQIWADSLGGRVEARRALFLGSSASNRVADEVYLVHAPLAGPLSSTDGVLSPVAFGIQQIGFDFTRHIVTWTR